MAEENLNSLLERIKFLESKKEELESKNEQLSKRELDKSIWQYFQEGGSRLPKLRRVGTATGPSTNHKHLPIDKVTEKEFGLVRISVDELKALIPIAAQIPFDETLEYSTEADVQRLCANFLEDMIKAANLRRLLKLFCELQIAELKADFWVISVNGFPVGAIEVKKPGKGGNLSVNLGQLFDYMEYIRSFHGIRSVFGILTDYNTWKICWLPSSDVAALATDLSYSSRETFPGPIPRELCISRDYHSSESSLAFAICSVLKKMHKSAEVVDPVPLISDTRSYILLDESSWQWRRGLEVSKLSLQPPSKSTKQFYLLRDFHGGADGIVWLGCSARGKLAVIKFQRRLRETEVGNEESRVDSEVAMWKKCGIDSVFKRKFSGRFAIIMPFAFHFSDNQTIAENLWKGETEGFEAKIKYLSEVKSKMKDVSALTVLEGCIERCSQAGVAHDDIEWRHVAIIPKITRPIFSFLSATVVDIEYAFIDLGRMREFAGSLNEKKTLARNMMNAAKVKLIPN